MGLAVGSSVGAWAELACLRVALGRKTDDFELPLAATAKMLGLAVACVVPALLLWRALPDWHIALQALPVVGLYALLYLGAAFMLGFEEINFWLGRFTGKLRR